MPGRRRGWMREEIIDKDLKRSTLSLSLLEPVILALLSHQAGHGYSMLSDLESVGVSSVHPSVVYRNLREMEDLGWIQSTWDAEQTQGPPRRTYRLTPQGQETLRVWHDELKRITETISSLMQ